MWLKDGEKTTKFFHGKASKWRKMNEITKLKDDQGIWWRGDENVERILINYFSELFTTSLSIDLDATCQVVRDNLPANLRD